MAFPPIIAAADKHTAAADGTVAWTVHLLRSNPACLPQILLALLGVLAVSLMVFHSFWLALLPMLAVTFSLSEYLFPIYYTLSAQTATAQHGLTSLEICWTDVRHAYLTDSGIKLSPLQATNSRFESLRGVYLRFDAANRETIIETVQRLRSAAQEG